MSWVDLVAPRLGGMVLSANDEFFAPKEALLRHTTPVFEADRFTARGKWMDGWETRRRREPGHDWAILRLGIPGIPREVEVDTAHFRGNYPESCAVDGAWLEPGEEATAEDAAWVELVRSPLEGHTSHRLTIDAGQAFTHLRLRIFPDGGVARFRAYGEVVPSVAGHGPQPDLASVLTGGVTIGSSDAFFGEASNLLLPGESRVMGEGWENRRRRGPGVDWVAVRLGIPGVVERIVVDTRHFKGNCPGACRIEGASLGEAPTQGLEGVAWEPLVDWTPLRPHRVHRLEPAVARSITHARLVVRPDGGVARLRLFGVPDEGARRRAGVYRLDTLPDAVAERRLRDTCGSSAWAGAMVGRRPFGDVEGLFAAADVCFDAMGEADWLEAFRSHPRIGGRGGHQSSRGASWSTKEQSGTRDAAQQVLADLAAANDAYFERFGFIYIVCASGRSAAEMLADLRGRFDHDPATEIGVAAGHQRDITRLRLERLLR